MYIDGYIARIQRPDHAGDAYFCGRHGKSCDSINTQYISDKYGVVRHIITGRSTDYNHRLQSFSMALESNQQLSGYKFRNVTVSIYKARSRDYT